MKVLVGTEKRLFELGNDETLLENPIAFARGADGWWAITDEHKLWSSSDGRAWTEAGSIRGLRANCVLAFNGGALVGTSEAHLVRVAGGKSERVRSFDNVKTRDEWYTPWGGPADVRSLSAGPDGAAYANVHVGGILRSDDGATWTPTSMDVDADVHQVLAHPTKPGLVFAATAIGLAESSDGGQTWEFFEEGMHAAYCRALAIAGDTMLVSASQSHTGRQAALYRRPLRGGRFERVTKGVPEWFSDNVDTYCLDAIGDDAVLGTYDGRVFTSTDAGRAWTESLSGAGAISCVALLNGAR
jgi:hypothetical protein